MSTFNVESFYDAIAEVIRREDSSLDVAKVTEVETRTFDIGYCETCSYETTVLEITYLTSSGREREYRYDGGFGDLMSELSRG